VHPFRNECAGGDDGTFADFGSVQDYGTNADESIVFDGAAVQADLMADGDTVPDYKRKIRAFNVEDTIVLNVRLFTDFYVMHVASDGDQGPDA